MINTPYEGYVDAHVAVYGRTVKADIYAKGDARPGWVSRLTVNTRLEVNKNGDQRAGLKGGERRVG